MTRAGIVAAVVERTNFPQRPLGKILDTLLTVVVEALGNGDSVTLRRVGRLYLVRQRAGTDGEHVYVGFRTARCLKRKLAAEYQRRPPTASSTVGKVEVKATPTNCLRAPDGPHGTTTPSRFRRRSLSNLP